MGIISNIGIGRGIELNKNNEVIWGVIYSMTSFISNMG